jgi:hypothetical protein
MPQGAWSPKRDRQYEHIKDSELDAGRTEDRAEEGPCQEDRQSRNEHRVNLDRFNDRRWWSRHSSPPS